MQPGKILKILMSGFGAAGTTFLLQVVLSHSLSIESFGFYAASNSLLSIIGPLASVGISGLFLRRACVTPEATDSYLITALRSLVITTVLSFVITSVLLSRSNGNSVVATCLASFYFPTAGQYLLIAYFQAKERFNLVSIFQSVLPVGRLLAVLVFLIFTSTMQSVAFALLTSHVLTLGIIFIIGKKYIVLPSFNLFSGFGNTFKFIRESVYYSLNGTLNVAQIQISTIVSILLFGSASSAMYSSANTLLAACYILPNLIFGTYFLPRYHKLDAQGALDKLPIKHGAIAFVMGIVLAVIVIGGADILVSYIYPDSFTESTYLLQVLSVSLPFRFFSTAIGASILSEVNIRKKLIASVTAITFQIGAVFIFSSYGIRFLAVSYVASEFVIAILYYAIFSSQYNKIKLRPLSE